MRLTRADAPISEAGDLTPKFHAIRKLISSQRQHSAAAADSPIARSAPKPNANAHPNAEFALDELPVRSLPKRAYGRVPMRFAGGLARYLKWAHANGRSHESQLPSPMELLGHYAGLMLYSHTCAGGCRGTLAAIGVRDRAHVYDESWRYRGALTAHVFDADADADADATYSVLYTSHVHADAWIRVVRA